MKKIYAKFTKERALEFQIETAIYEKEDGERAVEKRPLNPEAEKHMERMYENYRFFRTSGISLYLECEKKGSSLWFPFVRGKSLYDEVLKTVEKKDRDRLEKILAEYAGLIRETYRDQEPFGETPEFQNIFGEAPELAGLPAARKVDIDFTLDNLIRTDKGVRLLDYEWIFDFPVPLKFPLFRGIYAVWVKHSQALKPVISKKEFFDLFDISREERKCFQRMNDRFMEFVEGRADSYQKLLKNYQKPEVSIWKAGDEGPDLPVVFWGKDRQFFPERSEAYECGAQGRFRIEAEVSHFPETDCIRIDPTNYPSMIQVLRLEMEDEKYVRKLSPDEFYTNAEDTGEAHWIFLQEDPQIIIPLPEKCGWQKIVLEFQVVQPHLEQLETLISQLQSADQRVIARWQNRAREKTELAEGQARLLNQSAHKVAEYEHTIQLLKDKLAYIQSTKAYQYLLKKKVDQIHLWDELE